MYKPISILSVLSVSLLVGCATLQSRQGVEYEDLADRATKEYKPGQEYRMGNSGIVGTVEEDHIKVTYVIPDSVADGKIQAGDLVRGMQHRGMGGWGGIRGLVGVRMYRIGRDWDWHFYVTVERPSLRDGKGNTLTYDLLMPPDPGNLCHYGPTGFFAKRYIDHLVVDAVEKGSPSDGKLMKGDVILAVDGKPISLDAYNQFTEAVDKAESKEGRGELKLTVKRTGDLPAGSTATVDTKKKGKKQLETPAAPDESLKVKELDVVLNLKVLGKCSVSAPISCPKTDILITQTADYLVKSKNYGTLNWGMLGLLATGEKKYIKVVRDYLHAANWAQPPKNPEELVGVTTGSTAWHWGYQALLLTEYYLLTGDKFVLPAINKFAIGLAVGQDQAGLYGHRMHYPALGRAFGYGVMNQPTIPIFISLILAEKCGVKDKRVRNAIKRTHGHYNKWIGQGALPYGNHGPSINQFTNNGTSGSLAVAFALLGNKKGASFYAAMSAAASEEILLGHGGPVWNILWSGLGANVLGPEMTTAYNNEIHWLRTVTRTWNGRFVEMKGWGSDLKSGSWSTGSHLLNLSTGRRKIHITGKGMDKSLWVNTEKAEEIVEAGNIDSSSDQSLMTLLGSPYPPVRYKAAQALAMRDAQVADKVMELLSKGTSNQRIGAIHAIQNLKIEGTEDDLLNIVRNEKEELWVRQVAARTLAGMKEAKKYAPELLKVLVKDKPYDPYRELDLALGSALVKLYEPVGTANKADAAAKPQIACGPYATELDKEMFYKGVAKLLDHKHASGRGAGMVLIRNLPEEDLPKVIDKMVYLIEDKDKTYTSYTGSGRQDALEILYRHGIKESMDYTISTMKEPTGRGGPRMRARTRLLKTFGGEAKYLIPKIKEVMGKNGDEIVKQIEASKEARKMITIEEAKKK